MANYAMTLQYFRLSEEANQYALKAYKSDPQHPHCLHAIIAMSCLNNDKESFRIHSNEWFKRNKKEHFLKTMPLYSSVNPKLVDEFVNKYTVENIPQGHIPPNDIIERCQDKLMAIFGAPLNIVSEIMPNLEKHPTLVAWIQWAGDPEEGMSKYDRFENWYIENNYDIKTDVVNYCLELVGI